MLFIRPSVRLSVCLFRKFGHVTEVHLQVMSLLLEAIATSSKSQLA